MTESRIELLLTEHCHLCEQALDQLLSMRVLSGARLVTVDIALDDALSSEFAHRIPVLRCGGHCVDWPFSEADVARLLNSGPTQG